MVLSPFQMLLINSDDISHVRVVIVSPFLTCVTSNFPSQILIILHFTFSLPQREVWRI
jgi:hypothetical protein